VSVGYRQQLPQFNDAKLPISAESHHALQYSDIPDDGNFDCMFDFALFPEGSTSQVGGTESFFDSSFDGSASHTALAGNTEDFMEHFDAGNFDLQPGAGATLAVCDAPGLAAESA
jgi:hypothetical protein